jgi:hypothetical protein
MRLGHIQPSWMLSVIVVYDTYSRGYLSIALVQFVESHTTLKILAPLIRYRIVLHAIRVPTVSAAAQACIER